MNSKYTNCLVPHLLVDCLKKDSPPTFLNSLSRKIFGFPNIFGASKWGCEQF